MIDEITVDGVRFLTGKRAASIAGVSRGYVTRWCREGCVEGRRLAGGVWFLSLPSLETYLAEKKASKLLWRDQLRAQRRSEHASFA